MLKEEELLAVRNFLNDPIKKVLLIVGANSDVSQLEKISQLKQPSLVFDMSNPPDVEREMANISHDQPSVFIFTHGKLENYYVKFEFEKWSAQAIVFIDHSLLHPTLDPSVYFAPIIKNRLQRHLFTKIMLQIQLRPSIQPAAVTTFLLNPLRRTNQTANINYRNHYLNQRLMTNDTGMMQLLADRIIYDENFKQFLFTLVLASRDDVQMQVAAANAITALNYARVPFSDMDLSKINIPNADLTSAIMHKANVSNANLAAVNFQNTYLAETECTNSHMEGIRFGEWPYIDHKVTSTSCASSTQRPWIATAGGIKNDKYEIYVWDWQSGECIKTLAGHDLKITHMSISDNGEFLASASQDSTIRLWQLSDGKMLRIFKHHKGRVNCVIFGINENTLISCGEDGTIVFWSLESGNLLFEFYKQISEIVTLNLSKNKTYLAAGDSNGNIGIWDTNKFKAKKDPTSNESFKYLLTGHSARINCVVFNKEGTLIASSSNDYTIRLWAMSTGEAIYLLQGHTNIVSCIAFDYQQNILASSSKDKTVRLWDLETGKQLSVLQGHNEGVNAVIYCQFNNNYVLASISDDRTVRLWAYQSLRKTPTEIMHTDNINSLAFSPNGKLLASCSDDKSLKLWETTHGTLVRTLLGHSAKINCVVFNMTGSILASASSDNSIRLWRTHDGKTLYVLEGHKAKINSITFSVDGKYIVSGSDDNTIQLWDVSQGKWYKLLATLKSKINSVKYCPNKNLLAAGCADNTVQLFETDTGRLSQSLSGHTGPVNVIDFNESGNILASGSSDLTIRLWRMAEGKLVFFRELIGHTEPIVSLRFNKDYLASCGGTNSFFNTFDNTLRIWSINSYMSCVLIFLEKAASSIAWHPDTYLASSHNQTIKFWQQATKPPNNRWLLVRSIPPQQEFVAKNCHIQKTTNLSSSNHRFLQQRLAIGQPDMKSGIKEQMLTLISRNKINEARELLKNYPELLAEHIKKDTMIYTFVNDYGSSEFACMIIEAIQAQLKLFFACTSNTWKCEYLNEWLTGLKLLAQSKQHQAYINQAYQNCLSFMQNLENGYTTAVHEAIASAKTLAVSAVLQLPLNLNLEDKKYKSLPLHMALGQNEIMEILIKSGANVNAQDAHGKTTICLGTMQGLPTRGIRLLLDNGADINLPDKTGNTSLHYAIIYNHINIVRLFLERDANLQLLNKDGDNALTLCDKHKRQDIKQLLLAHQKTLSLSAKKQC